MTHVVPPQFLFRWSFPVRHCPELSETTFADLTAQANCRLPELADLTGQPPFAELYVGWNDRGFAVGVTVRGKQLPTASEPLRPLESDGMQVWIDTRCTQNVHRATRFCHHFVLLPGSGEKPRQPAIVTQLPLAQAREQSRTDQHAAIQVAAEFTSDGYRLSAWFPAAALTGYEPASHPRLGFYALVKDTELGEQPLTVGHEFPFAFDPSIWQTLELAR